MAATCGRWVNVRPDRLFFRDDAFWRATARSIFRISWRDERRPIARGGRAGSAAAAAGTPRALARVRGQEPARPDRRRDDPGRRRSRLRALPRSAEIVAAAGVSRRTFYNYYSDKEEAFFDVYRQVTDFLCEAMAGAGEAERGWPAKVRAELGALLGSFAANPDLVRFTSPRRPPRAARSRASYRRFPRSAAGGASARVVPNAPASPRRQPPSTGCSAASPACSSPRSSRAAPGARRPPARSGRVGPDALPGARGGGPGRRRLAPLPSFRDVASALSGRRGDGPRAHFYKNCLFHICRHSTSRSATVIDVDQGGRQGSREQRASCLRRRRLGGDAGPAPRGRRSR